MYLYVIPLRFDRIFWVKLGQIKPQRVNEITLCEIMTQLFDNSLKHHTRQAKTNTSVKSQSPFNKQVLRHLKWRLRYKSNHDQIKIRSLMHGCTRRPLDVFVHAEQLLLPLCIEAMVGCTASNEIFHL